MSKSAKSFARKPAPDIAFDFSSGFGRGGITKALQNTYKKRLRLSLERVRREVANGELGFWKLPAVYGDKATLAPVRQAAKNLRSRFDNLVIIGIGGSALGARMLKDALAHPYHNELPDSKRKGMRLYLLENNDPAHFNALMSHLDLKRTVFNVVSKSGSTAETASQFILVRDILKRRFPDTWAQHLLFTTDPEKGILNKLAATDGIQTLDVPSDVGGRFSVLSPVGLLPALALGVDASKLLAGAEHMAQRCLSDSIADNPALAGALLHIIADQQLGRNMVVAFPYADGLKAWTEWFCQLWAESLGKAVDESGGEVHTGTTPIKTLGAIDQHSQMQLYMEGPDDKVFMFIRNESFGKPLAFPPKSRIPEALQYFAGHSMQELLLAEQTASRFALNEQKRMTYQVTLPKLDADTLGQLVFWAEAMTVFAGYLYGVNPFDQPGVELGKQFAYGLMGRAGFESFSRRIRGE